MHDCPKELSFSSPKNVGIPNSQKTEMATVVAGTDTYGRVKSIGGTSIVTQFAMLQFLPLYPLRSYYASMFKIGQSVTVSVPFVASLHTRDVYGIPLAQLDQLSVNMAYLRGMCGALTVIGFMVIFPLLAYLSGEHLDAFARNMALGLAACFTIGAICGLLTYVLPLTPRREQAIRKYCGELLGICVDPALVPQEFSSAMEEFAAERMVSQSIDHDANPRLEAIRRLISVRSRISQSTDVQQSERETDEILSRLNTLSRTSPCSS
jgi:hypothetical protein